MENSFPNMPCCDIMAHRDFTKERKQSPVSVFTGPFFPRLTTKDLPRDFIRPILTEKQPIEETEMYTNFLS